MAFTKIIPPVRVVTPKSGTPMVRIEVREHKKGITAGITLADSMLTSLPDYKNINYACVYIGQDEDAGKMRIEFIRAPVKAAEGKGKGRNVTFEKGYQLEEGALGVHKPHLGGANIIVPSFEGMPQFKVGRLPCPVVEQPDENGAFVVQLPVEQWQAAIALKNTAKQRSVITENAKRSNPEAPQLVNLAGAEIPAGEAHVKPIQYMKKKGFIVAKLGGDFWSIRADSVGSESERIDTAALLAQINRLRARETLKAIDRTRLVDETRLG
jgi:hypothetical protein